MKNNMQAVCPASAQRRISSSFASVLAATCAVAIMLCIAPRAASQETASPTARPVSSDRLQSLVNATATQLKMTYRYNKAELELRREQLEGAIDAWRKSARTGADNQRLAQWLRSAIRTSMPGSRQPLPPLPTFGRQPRVATTPAPMPRRTTATKPVAEQGRRNAIRSTADDVSQATLSNTSDARRPTDNTSRRALSERGAPTSDFWSEHPASSELPAELTGEDPFRDDEPTTGVGLFD